MYIYWAPKIHNHRHHRSHSRPINQIVYIMCTHLRFAFIFWPPIPTPNRIESAIESRERERAHFHSNVCLNASCRLCCSSRLPLLLYALFARSFTYCSTIWYWIHYSYQISSKHLIRSHVQPMFNCNQWTAGQQWVYPATLPLAKLQKKKRQHTENGGTMMAALSFVLCVCVCSAIVPHQHSTAQQKCVRHADVQCIFSLISKSENLNTAN